MGRTAILLKFNERYTGIPPSDLAGGLVDLTPPTGLGTPDSVEAMVGRGREFTPAKAYEALEATANQTRLRRTMAIEAIVDLSNIRQDDGTYTIISRGKGNSSAERTLWGLHIVIAGAVATLQMFWQKAGGTDATVTGANFVAVDDYVYVAAVRRWEDDGQVYVDYYVNGLPIGTASSSDGDIENGANGTTLVGCAGDGAGGYENFYDGIIDEIRVSNDERTPEEVAHQFDALFLYPSHGYDLIRSLVPPGAAYSTDPDSGVQRELMVEGDGLSVAWQNAEDLLKNFWPDRATRTLDRWEAVTRLYPKPGDSYAKRRKRVAAHLLKVAGYNRDKIRDALSEILDLAAEDLEILENSNRFDEKFDAISIDPRWFKEANDGTITQASDLLTLAFQASDDSRWDGAMRRAVSVRTSYEGEAELVSLIDTYVLPGDGDFAGLFLYNHVTADAHLLGIERVAGTGLRWTSRRVVFGSVSAANVLSTTPPPVSGSGQIGFRVRTVRDSDPPTVDVAFNPNGLTDEDWEDLATDLPSIVEGRWFGLFVRSGVQAPASGGSIAFDSLSAWMSNNRSVYHWSVFRDPLLPGTPDIPGAQLIVERIKPAHTIGSVTQTRELLYDSNYSYYDGAPMAG